MAWRLRVVHPPWQENQQVNLERPGALQSAAGFLTGAT